MKLKQLIDKLEYRRLENMADCQIEGVCCNSNSAHPGYLFVAIEGHHFDGHNFISQALKKGASAVIVEKDVALDEKVPKIIVADSQTALACMSALFFDYPDKKLKIIGITGTNGKTTVSYLIEQILSSEVSGVIGTINYRIGQKQYPAPNTTPQADTLWAFLQEVVLAQGKYAIIEVSSHALVQRRIEGLKFAYAIFTNLSPEHLDYHENLDAYFSSKAELFKQLDYGGTVIINADDYYGQKLIALAESKVVSFGIDNQAQIQAKNIRLSIEHSFFKITTPCGELDIKTPFIGKHNVYNILAAVSLAISEKISFKQISGSLNSFKGVPGRLESVKCDQDFSVFIDYAHTEDALEKVLRTLRQIRAGRIIVVFGCGGDRDKAKRPAMGRVAAELADLVIVTSDNPRGENLEKIISDITQGIDKQKDNYQVIPDRSEAIKRALSLAKAGDTILIAGKGHESTQIFAKETIHFNDREEVETILTRNP